MTACGYGRRAVWAKDSLEDRNRTAPEHLRFTVVAKDLVHAARRLRLWWNPEQIAGHLGSTSHETIYVHIWADKRRGGSLWTHLRQAGKKRRKRYATYDSR